MSGQTKFPAARDIGPARIGDANCCRCGQGGLARRRIECAGEVSIWHAVCFDRHCKEHAARPAGDPPPQP